MDAGIRCRGPESSCQTSYGEEYPHHGARYNSLEEFGSRQQKPSGKYSRLSAGSDNIGGIIMRLRGSRMVLIVVVCIGLLSMAALPSRSDELRVAAASDLRKAFSEIGAVYEKSTAVHVALTFGASGILTKQIENGAPFDLFAAANTSYMDDLQKRDLVLAEDVHVYAVGHIGLFA